MWRFPPGPRPPEAYLRALVRFEDRRFYSHCGFDPASLVRAAIQNLTAGRIISGGSTITMQAARLARSGAPRTVVEKALELWMAIGLELRMGKDAIAGLYASNAPFGGNVVGLEGAGFRWFGRPTSGLSLAEAATLAVLPNAPASLNPGRGRDALKAKRDRLLESMAEAGLVDGDGLALSLAEPLPPEPYPLPSLAPHLLTLASGASARSRLDSSIDASLQARVAAIVEANAARLAPVGVYSAACVVADLRSGEILAYVGNAASPPGGEATRSVDCARAPRSSGSIFKPFLYAAMLETGELYPRALLPDLPTRIGSFSPENATKEYEGVVRADEALSRSLNVPFVRLLRTYGVERFRSLLAGLGFSTLWRRAEDYGLPLVIGGAEATLVDAAAAYRELGLAALGVDGPGGLSWEAGPGGSARLGAPPDAAPDDAPFGREAAWLTLQALAEVERPEEEAAFREYASARRIAWKTGTSFGNRDAWAIGITPDRVVAVWAGNAGGEGSPGLRGHSSAAPVLFSILAAMPASGWFDKPTGFKTQAVCADSGYPASRDCPSSVIQELPPNARTDGLCPYCETIFTSLDGKYRLSASSAPLGDMTRTRRFTLPPAIEWYYRRGRMSYSPLPPWAPGSAPATEEGAIIIMSPERGTTLYVPIELDGRPGQAVFRAFHQEPASRLHWHLDGSYLGSTTGEHKMAARPGFGPHELTVVDDAGNAVTVPFDVESGN